MESCTDRNVVLVFDHARINGNHDVSAVNDVKDKYLSNLLCEKSLSKLLCTSNRRIWTPIPPLWVDILLRDWAIAVLSLAFQEPTRSLKNDMG